MPHFVAGRNNADLQEQAGAPPEMARVPDAFSYVTPAQIRAGQGGRTTKSLGRLNLRAVADVLETYGLDPIEEVAKVVVKTEPVLDDRGQPVLGEDGQPLMKPTLPPDVRLRTLLELAQYSRPKLKAVEITQKEPELSDEQIDRRLEALMASRKKAAE